MFKKEVAVEDFAVGEHAKHLVNGVFLVDEFVASKSVDATHVTPDEGEYEPMAEVVAVLVCK